MKFSKIALACGLAVAAMSAHAVDLNVAVPNFSTAKVIFLSGATAPDNFMGDIASNMLTGEIAIRSTDAGILHRAYFGPAATGITGVTAGTNILFIKRSKGGSVWGVDPVARGQRVETLDFANCTALVVNLVPTPGNPLQPYSWQCGVKGVDPLTSVDLGGAAGLVPDFGVSDVEPALFRTPYNTENGLPALSTTELARLSNKGVNQLMMGIVATDAVAATTHMSRSQYGAMLAGKLADWSSIDGSTDPVVVCRRVNGSGTQTSYNWFFSGFPCNVASNGWFDTPPAAVSDSFGFNSTNLNLALPTVGTVANPIIVDPTAGLTIVENSGSGDVRNCLRSAQYGQDFTVTGSNSKTYKVLFSTVPGTPYGNATPLLVRGGPSKAIGTLSLDSYPNANTAVTIATVLQPTSGFSFRHLDGAGTFNGATQTSSAGATGMAPSKANLLAGKYDFVVELSMQGRNAAAGVGLTPAGIAAGQGLAIGADPVKLALYNDFVRRSGLTRYTGNDGGTFTTTPNAFATLPTVDSYDAKPAFVSKFSRNGNTCAPLVSFPSL